MDVRLQPLRIPTGWHVVYNDGLWEIDPDAELIPADERSWIFKEDMLQMIQAHFNRLLDVGWYSEGDVAGGHYELAIYEGDFKGRLLNKFKTRDRLTLVREIERLLAAVSHGEF